jgi:hypothetical protein
MEDSMTNEETEHLKARMVSLIKVIRNRKDWEPSHKICSFPKGEVGYYDTDKKDSYFSLKFDGIEVNTTGRAVRFDIPWEKFSGFSYPTWLEKLEEVMLCDYLVKDGKTYLLKELT